jgi:CHAT domain-containing protein
VRLDVYRAQMAADQILLAPLPVEDGTLAIAVTRDGLTWRKTSPSAATVRQLVTRIRAAIADAELTRSAPFDRAAARLLYDALIPPAFAATMARHPSLSYFASGNLATLPAALLIGPTQSGTTATNWLIRSHAITVAPTLALPVQRSAAADPVRPFLGVGAPVVGHPDQSGGALALRDRTVATGSAASFAPLPAAERELRAMRSLLDPGGRLVMAGAGATEAALKALTLDHFRVIAFATHAIEAGDAPGLLQPALVMTAPAEPQGEDDGLLTAGEIAALKLDADWVILSACNTAAGGDGQTYAGLSTAFVQAGARSLLVSHWPVRDDAAARLTVSTVRGAAAGKPRAVALQQAMLRLMADPHVPGAANPAVWAPFVLVGS